MKIIRKQDCDYINGALSLLQFHLSTCIETMQGKYGTHEAIREIKNMIRSINHLLSKKESDISFYQKFKTPPNTPKSRRLGWHKKGAKDEVR